MIEHGENPNASHHREPVRYVSAVPVVLVLAAVAIGAITLVAVPPRLGLRGTWPYWIAAGLTLGICAFGMWVGYLIARAEGDRG